MPAPVPVDAALVDQLINNLQAVVGPDAVLSHRDELLVYECDGLPQHKHLPRAVVFPTSTEQTAAVMRLLAAAKVPFTPRGAGTGLSGGALALDRGVVIEMARMRHILNIDVDNRTARVQPGVVNVHVSRAVAHLGLHYVPDPSSQGTCTIGGNIAENAGGIHCLKYGTTTDHILGITAVLGGGQIVELGGEVERPGYDLRGVFIGSEGTFGIATEATLRLVPVPKGVRTLLAEFGEVDAASHAVSAIIAAGIMPAALEMMDREIIRAVEDSVFAAGLSLDIGAALLIELDGLDAGLDAEAERVKAICLAYGARSCRLAHDEPERKKLWAARKGAFGAVGRIAPDSMIQDAVVPRSRLPEVMADAYRISAKFRLRLANVFHAGDGNLHPFICFDSRSADEVLRVKEAGRELMETCVRAGGTITGEHGVGLDKRDFLPLIFSPDDMELMSRVRRAFDPEGLCNPAKIIPVLKGCGEARAVRRQAQTDEADDRGTSFTDLQEESTTNIEISATGNGSIVHHRRSFDPAKAASQLCAIVGESNVSESQQGSLRVAPASIEETSQLMKLAARNSWTVVPAGAETWLEAGNELRESNLILSTLRLNRLLDHEPADLVASTQAGVSLQAFNDSLAQRGQWLPLDPPDDGRATLGGVVATGMSGAQKCGYGLPRTYVIGMRVVTAEGIICKAGGRVVKNVAGYDLCKLFTGSFGSLGIICELTFKLRPRPAKELTLIGRGTLSTVLLAAWSLYRAELLPVGLEILSRAFPESNANGNSEGPRLLVRFAGIENTVDYQAATAAALLRDAGLTAVEIDQNDQQRWRNLQSVAVNARLSCRIEVNPAQIASVIESFDTSAQREDFIWHAGIAAGRLRIMVAKAGATEHFRLLKEMRSKVHALGGSLVIENAPDDATTSIGPWGDLGAPELMQRVKRQLDPEEILSPGRFEI